MPNCPTDKRILTSRELLVAEAIDKGCSILTFVSLDEG